MALSKVKSNHLRQNLLRAEKTFYEFWNAFSDEKYTEAGLLLKLKELKNNSSGSLNEAIQDIISMSEIKFS